MDDIVKKLAGLGLPGVILVILTVTTGGSSAAVAATLTALGGPFGIVGGIALLGLVTLVGDAVTGYGIEAILKGIYTERSKTESVIFILKEIQSLPITEELKLKLKNQLSVAMITDTKEVRYLKKIEIIEE
ncbi:hypothetical protein [Nostoc sp. TCL240-02]|uniref:hypothetical protein n=1 Tax=Nostoc sp. TCL240-02 TaxID=2572090 RepID=UPI00157F941F|nr:hypothetical protein [Nostoc sp. TCL240-02]QKQ75855.1 hypothetical protein FBB35_23455 [Nostoc sp. TCL240-02]